MNEMKLMYKQAASRWEESIPIGNGSLGAMIMGGAREEILGLNEESLWSGYYKDKNNGGAFESLSRARELIFAGKCPEAEELIRKNMLGEYNESYLPLGNLCLRFKLPEGRAPEDYVRWLDIDRAVAHTHFSRGGVEYRREYFASYPHQAIFVRLYADRPVLSFTAAFESQLSCQSTYSLDGISVSGRCPEHVDPSYIAQRENGIVQGKRGMAFEAGIRLLSCDGTVSEDGGALNVWDAQECVLAVSYNHKAAIPAGTAYETIKQKHIDDYRRLYSRTELYLGEQSELPTDERLKNLKSGKEDNGLFALYFQYGRYLLISSSREGGLPANLQGIWSWELRAPWSSNFTININTQMNYWHALSCNLEECLRPYTSFVKRVCEEGKKTAAVNYHCRGFVAHHNLDYWGNTGPVGCKTGDREGGEGSVNWSFWPMGGAWLVQELYYIYEYNQDRRYLEEDALPLLREAALFLNDWLTEYKDSYVTCPSTSPENSFYLPDGRKSCVSYGSAMDMEIVREAFMNYRRACDALGVRDGLYDETGEKLNRLAPPRIGSQGQLLEWQEEYGEPEPGHRHVSHLYGLFPSELFAGDSGIKEACRISLKRRLENGGGHTGWSCAFIINLFAVLGDRERAYDYLYTLLTRSTYPNLWDAHPPFQIDGNFGGTAGIANMLVQDRGGEIKLLPALPAQFQNGWVRGLCLKGRRAVDIAWENGREISHRFYDR